MALTKAAQTFQASTSNAAGATTTGTGVDLTAAYESGVVGEITNGATGPTIGCDFVVDISNDNADWTEFARFSAGTTANGVYAFAASLPPWVMYARTRFLGNTAQSVTVEADGYKITAV